MPIQAKNNIYWNVSTKTGDYTLIADDVLSGDHIRKNIIEVESVIDSTITLPDDSVNIPWGVTFIVRQKGVGSISIIPGSGVTIESPYNPITNGLYSSFELIKKSSNTFEIINSNFDFLQTETDPTVPAHVKAILTTDISNWDAKPEASTQLTDSTDLVRNDQDTYVSEPKVVQIITLTQAEKDAIVTPIEGALYIVPET